MLHITTMELCELASAKLFGTNSHANVSAVTTDTRKIEAGSAFVAFKGERTDANDLLELAVAQGLSAFVMSREPSEKEVAIAEAAKCTLIYAADPEEFLLELAGLWRRKNPQWIVIGVTGSVGKTTTKDMLKAACLACGLKVTATQGNFNNLIGMPLTLLSADATDDVVVLEMGMNHKGELSRLTAAARPNFAVITNIGTSHIGLLGSRKNIALAKSEIIEGMQPTEAGLWGLSMTSDNDFADMIEHDFAALKGLPVSYVGQKSDTKELSLTSAAVHTDDEGFASFDVLEKKGPAHHVVLKVPGTAVIADALLATDVLRFMGLSVDRALRGIETMQHSAMRLEIIKREGRPRVIDDSYNASPTSLAAALDVFERTKCAGKKVAVIGQVGELGDMSEHLHTCMGAYLAAKPIDILVFVGGRDAQTMAEAAKTMGASEDKIEVFETAEDALAVIAPVLSQQDLVLAKGSRSVGLDRFVKGVVA